MMIEIDSRDGGVGGAQRGRERKRVYLILTAAAKGLPPFCCCSYNQLDSPCSWDYKLVLAVATKMRESWQTLTYYLYCTVVSCSSLVTGHQHLLSSNMLLS